MLVAFQSLMLSFQQPVNTLVDFGTTLQELEGDLNRLDDVLGNALDPEVERAELRFPTQKLQGYVELRNITFGYSPIEPPLIENFNLSLQPGQRVALVGASGSGKSTLAKLICGLDQPWEGEILLDGYPRKEIPRSVLANSLSLVEQDIFLFGGTVRDNLTLWDVTVPDEEMIKACQDSAIHETIMAIPGGYDGQLLEGGANLSGGQRQRLEIARALVKNPAILVMDEATSALDNESEKIVQLALDRVAGHKTVIAVAHRLSTLKDFDRIMVMKDGKKIEEGAHSELISREGEYKKLFELSQRQ
jgi:ATP-binding cassette subfamily C protein